jgi:hypothetical protein
MSGSTAASLLNEVCAQGLISSHTLAAVVLRFETVEPKSSKPHPAYVSARVNVPNNGMPANELLKPVAMSPPGWQATIPRPHDSLQTAENLQAWKRV